MIKEHEKENLEPAVASHSKTTVKVSIKDQVDPQGIDEETHINENKEQAEGDRQDTPYYLHPPEPCLSLFHRQLYYSRPKVSQGYGYKWKRRRR